MVTPCGIGTVSLPLGPSTSNRSPIVTFTPLGSGIGFFPTLDIVQVAGGYQTWQSTSPPTFSFRALMPVITPRGVVRMLIPNPPSTRGTSLLPTYTRQPGRETRSMREITGTFPGVYLR